ncbi:MAG: AAA family ATPase [Anaerolineae bacterium]|nr:AAA family ATPase [Anaerolineae bacterium]
MSSVALQFLGVPRIERDGNTVHVDTRKAYALLAYLALTGVAQSRDTLAALLWPESDNATARGSLRRTLSSLNAALNGIGLQIERESVALEFPVLSIDVITFEQHIAAHRDTAAAEIYKGDFLQGFSLRDSADFDNWQYTQTERLRRLLSSALERLAMNTGNLEVAIRHAQRWLVLDSLHESAHRQLMRLYAASGQRSLALKQYRECVRILDEELGVSPLEETSRLYQSILEDSGPFVLAADKDRSEIAVVPTTTPMLPFVGRETELALLQKLGTTGGQFLVIEGEAGVGKTRLAQTYLELARQAGCSIRMSTCYEGEYNLVYAPFSELLSELDDQTLLVETPGAQSRLFAAMQRSIVAQLPNKHGILFIDNVHWADTASCDLLTYLVRRFDEHSPSILVTWRSEDISKTHRLRLLVGERIRSGKGLILPLERLTNAEVRQIVQTALPTLDPEVATQVYQEAEGLPFFLAEYLALLTEGAAPEELHKLPQNIQDLLRSRLAAVSEAGQQILHTAAVIEHSFDFETLRETSGRSEDEVIDALEELIRRGLLSEITTQQIPHYSFIHEKLRTLVYQDTGLARRRSLHRRVAQSLGNRMQREGESGANASRIASHYELAGYEREAAGYYWIAGNYARRLYANHDALAYLQLALALGYPDLCLLHQTIGDLQTLSGDYSSAIHSYELALSSCATAASSYLEHRIGRVFHRLGEWSLAERYYEMALEPLTEVQDASPRAAILADWSLTAHQNNDPDRAQMLALGSLEAAGSQIDALAQAYNMLGILARSRGDYGQAIIYLQQSLMLSQQLDDPGARIAALNNLALVQRDNDQSAAAVETLSQALALCKQQGDLHRAAALHNNLADLFHAAGKEIESMVQLKQAVTLFAEIGIEAGSLRPEIWKLTEW